MIPYEEMKEKELKFCAGLMFLRESSLKIFDWV